MLQPVRTVRDGRKSAAAAISRPVHVIKHKNAFRMQPAPVVRGYTDLRDYRVCSSPGYRDRAPATVTTRKPHRVLLLRRPAIHVNHVCVTVQAPVSIVSECVCVCSFSRAVRAPCFTPSIEHFACLTTLNYNKY